MLFPFRDDNPTRHTPVVTYGLVAVNVLAFLWLPGNNLTYSSGVALWAHIGGFLAGLLVMPVLNDLVQGTAQTPPRDEDRSRDDREDRYGDSH